MRKKFWCVLCLLFKATPPSLHPTFNSTTHSGDFRNRQENLKNASNVNGGRQEERRTTKYEQQEEAFPPWDYGKLMNYKFWLSCSSSKFYFGNKQRETFRGSSLSLPSSHRASSEQDEEQKRTHTIPLNPQSVHLIAVYQNFAGRWLWLKYRSFSHLKLYAKQQQQTTSQQTNKQTKDWKEDKFMVWLVFCRRRQNQTIGQQKSLYRIQRTLRTHEVAFLRVHFMKIYLWEKFIGLCCRTFSCVSSSSSSSWIRLYYVAVFYLDTLLRRERAQGELIYVSLCFGKVLFFICLCVHAVGVGKNSYTLWCRRL